MRTALVSHEDENTSLADYSVGSDYLLENPSDSEAYNISQKAFAPTHLFPLQCQHYFAAVNRYDSGKDRPYQMNKVGIIQ